MPSFLQVRRAAGNLKITIVRIYVLLEPLTAGVYTISVNIEYDPAKDTINTKKHGVSLLAGANVFSDVEILVIPTMRVEDGERRFRAIGMVAGRLRTVIYVMRNDRHRFISVRKSNVSETRTYNRA